MDTPQNNLEAYTLLADAEKETIVKKALFAMVMEIATIDTKHLQNELKNPSGWLNGYCELLANEIDESQLVFTDDHVRVMALKSLQSDEMRETVVLEAANKMSAALENQGIKPKSLDNPGLELINFIHQKLAEPEDRSSGVATYEVRSPR